MRRLTREMSEFLAGGVAHQFGACGLDRRPHICRGLAAAEELDGRVALLLPGAAGFELLPAVRETRQISAVFVMPRTFKALHLKGSDAEVALAGHEYRALLEARLAAFDAQIAPFGFTPDFTSAWYTVPDDDLMVVRFTPYAAWNQTPGPGAGEMVELGRG